MRKIPLVTGATLGHTSMPNLLHRENRTGWQPVARNRGRQIQLPSSYWLYEQPPTIYTSRLERCLKLARYNRAYQLAKQITAEIAKYTN